MTEELSNEEIEEMDSDPQTKPRGVVIGRVSGLKGASDAGRSMTALGGGIRPLTGMDLSALTRFQPSAGLTSDAFTRAGTTWVTPALDLSRFSAAWAQAFMPGLAALNRSINAQLAQMVNNLFDFSALWSDTLEALTRSVQGAVTRYYPANWANIARPSTGELDAIVLQEGIPLCWVPPGDVVARLIKAPSAQARRDLLGRMSPRIVDACDDALDHVTSTDGLRYVRFARAALRSIRDGHREAGQALAVNTLDTLVTRYGLRPPGESKRPDIARMDIKDALVLGALWSTYFSFNGNAPVAEVPRALRRHATAHAVSAQQYSLRNATLAVMHLVSVLRWLETNGYEFHGKRLWR